MAAREVAPGEHGCDQRVTSRRVTCGNSVSTGLIVPSGEVGGREHCSACQVATELEAHRDATAGGWSIRRATLNFAILTARRACPAYEPQVTSQGGDDA